MKPRSDFGPSPAMRLSFRPSDDRLWLGSGAWGLEVVKPEREVAE